MSPSDTYRNVKNHFLSCTQIELLLLYELETLLMSAKNKNKKTKKQQKGKTSRKAKMQLPLWKDRRILLAGGIAFLVTLFCYIPSLSNGFVNWDDPDYVEKNVLIHQVNGENIKAIFSEPIAENYHPLTFLSLMVDYAIGDGDPAPFHATNLILHLLTTLAVFFFILTISKRNVLVAFVSALIFGIHPLHVESVAWVTERKDVLYGLFFVMGLITYAWYAETGQRKYLMYTFLLYLLSMLSKPAAVTFFLVLFLMDYWYDRGWGRKVIFEKLPFIALAVGLSILTIMIQSDTAVKDLEQISLINRVFAGGYGFNTYVLKFLIPFNLATFYPYPPLDNPPVYFYLMPLLGLAIVGGWWWLFRKNKPALFGGLFFLLTISITLQLFSFGGAILSERYTYIPYIGLAFCMGILMDYLLKSYPKQKSMIYGIAGAYALFLAVSCFQQTKVWKNGGTLWSQVIENMAFPTGVPLSNRGYFYKDQGQLDAAMRDFEESLRINSSEHGARVGKANILFDQQQYDQALAEYNTVLSKKPNHLAALNSRGACLGAMQRFNEALTDLNRVLEINSRDLNALKNRAVVHSSMGQHELALTDFQQYLRYEPDDVDIINSLGVEYQHLRDHNKAVEQFTRAIRYSPNNGMLFNNRGISNGALGQQTQAAADFQRAQQLGYPVNPAYLGQ